MKRVYWDSMLFIYMLEANPIFAPKVERLYDAMLRRGETLCTSIFTVGEVLTGPRKRSDFNGVKGIRSFFGSPVVEVLPFTIEVAERYSSIRAETRVRQADAIHLASAAAYMVDLFVTNDDNLRALSIPGIRYLADLDGKVW